MEFIYVNSTNIKAIAISGKNLVIKFNNNSIYEYKNAAREFTKIINADSKGKYFHQYIKNQYSYIKIG